MKTFNTRFAIRIFTVVTAVDVLLAAIIFALSFRYSVHSRFLTDVWWAVNLPSLPLATIAHKLGDFGVTILILCSWIFSALVWSAISGFVFRHKHVA